MINREDLPEEITLEELLALSIEEARRQRDHPQAREDGSVRQLALVTTKLEEAALWLCEHQAREHNGDNALLDWLRRI